MDACLRPMLVRLLAMMPHPSQRSKPLKHNLTAIEPNQQVANAFMRDIELVLCNDPRYGVEIVPAAGIWAVPGDLIVGVYDISDLVIYYTFDESVALFLSIKQFDPSQG